MAEFIGVISSLAGIVTFGAQVALLLFKCRDTLKSAGEDVGWLGTEISMFCAVLNELKTTLERAKLAGISLESLGRMEIILQYSHSVIQKIQEVLHRRGFKLEGEEVKLSIVGRATWFFTKDTVDKQRLRLESSKGTLNLMMIGFNWALLLEQKG
jgi:hypothetical protein